jgi:hypothetical protein
MGQVIISAEMLAKLQGLRHPLDFCNEEGQVLGHFVPFASGITPADLEPAIDAAELRQRGENFQGRPLSELLAEWEKRK